MRAAVQWALCAELEEGGWCWRGGVGGGRSCSINGLNLSSCLEIQGIVTTAEDLEHHSKIELHGSTRWRNKCLQTHTSASPRPRCSRKDEMCPKIN